MTLEQQRKIVGEVRRLAELALDCAGSGNVAGCYSFLNQAFGFVNGAVAAGYSQEAGVALQGEILAITNRVEALQPQVPSA